MSRKNEPQRFAWALTGSGHFFTESLALMNMVDPVDLFITKAAGEVIRMYLKEQAQFPAHARVFKDTTASAAPVGNFYHGLYHTLIISPATSNTVAKCVAGISDSLATNAFAQAGKTRVPIIIFPCDTLPEHDTAAPHGMVKVYPRRIDLENSAKLTGFEKTTVVQSLAELEQAIRARVAELAKVSADQGVRQGDS